MDEPRILKFPSGQPAARAVAEEDAIQLQPEIVVHPARRMLLDHIGIGGGVAALGRGFLAGGLRGLGEIPLGSVGVEGLAHRAGV